jgi:hypothetical protein
MNKYLIITIIVVSTFLFTQCQKNFRKDYFIVNKIISGNQLVLTNGYLVHLIGIENTSKSESFLKQNVQNNKVKLVFDSRNPYKRIHPKVKDKSFYAYLILETGECINSKMLQNNISKLFLQPVLNDSLHQYMKYTKIVREEIMTKNKKLFAVNCYKELIKLQESCDYMNPTTRDFAVKIAGKSSGAYNIGQICKIFATVCPPNWKYVNDPLENEFYSKASRTISQTNLSGDCDDFAILLYSLITAIGGKARINFVVGLTGGHAFTEIDISIFNFAEVQKTIENNFPDYKIDQINYRTDSKGIWLNLDWWASFPGGPYMDFYRSMTFYPIQNDCNEN